MFLMYSSICMLPNLCEKITKCFRSQFLKSCTRNVEIACAFLCITFSLKDYTKCFAKIVDVKGKRRALRNEIN